MFAYWNIEKRNDCLSDICFKTFQQKINKNKVGVIVELALAKILKAVEVVCWVPWDVL